MQKHYVDWTSFDSQVEELAQKIKNVKLIFNNIYAIPRGGLIIGTILSHKLGLPMIFDINKIDRQTLIVDDISDTGETLLPFSQCRTACLDYRVGSKSLPTFFVNRIVGPQWIIYPWENKDSQTVQDYKL